MKKLMLTLAVLASMFVAGCNSRVSEYEKVLKEAGASESEIKSAVEEFKKLNADEQKAALEMTKAAAELKKAFTK